MQARSFPGKPLVRREGGRGEGQGTERDREGGEPKAKVLFPVMETPEKFRGGRKDSLGLTSPPYSKQQWIIGHS